MSMRRLSGGGVEGLQFRSRKRKASATNATSAIIPPIAIPDISPADNFLDLETGVEVEVEDAATPVVEGEVELIHELSPVARETMMPETPPVRFCASAM